MADAADLNPLAARPCGFESHPRYQLKINCSLRADGVRHVEDDAPRAALPLPHTHVVSLLGWFLVRGLRPQLVRAVDVAQVAGVRDVSLRLLPRRHFGLAF